MIQPGQENDMAEKVIGEIRFIETEDGFRIEVKGDKERLRQMGWDPNRGPQAGGQFWGMGFGPGARFWRKKWHGTRRRHHGPPPGADFWTGPWEWWGCWDDDFEEDEESPEGPPKGV